MYRRSKIHSGFAAAHKEDVPQADHVEVFFAREPCVQYQGAGLAAELGSGRDAELVRDLEEALAQSRILQSGVLGMQGVLGRRTEHEKARQKGAVEHGKGQELLR
jgi:hypothetical protein